MLMEEMMSNCNYNRSIVLLAKRKLIELNPQLNGLDATSAWKHVAIGKCTMSNTEMGSDSTTGGLSRERRSTLMLKTTVGDPFPMPTTITPLINKHTCENEEHVCKSSPLPTKFLDSTYDDDFHGGFPILEELHP